MEWTVFTTLAAIVGLGVTVGVPIITLNVNIAKLTVVLDAVKAELEEQKKALSAQRADSKESHRRIWAHNDEQDQTLADHETRLRVLESKDN